ncbi:hypothetical protein [Agarivorans sp. QJM3NY_33]|uniref:hypothetical protein n=1 Tax=Agarivorans sp. QJM3NY_33 TaxID=3421432 RepID=UPI003F6BA163
MRLIMGGLPSSIIQRLGINEAQWLTLSGEFERHFSGAVGQESLLRQYHQHMGHKRTAGLSCSKRLLNRA